MSRTIFTGKGKLYWVADPTGAGTVVTLAAPTATQVNTGTNVTAFLRRGTLALPQSGNLVDTSDASSKFNSTDLGTFGGDKATATMYRDSVSGSDTAWPLFAEGLRGFLIVLPWGTAGASPAAADRCWVYQMACNVRTPLPGAENDPILFSVEWAITSPPNKDATLV
jgi:hypothetical protein